MQTENDTSKTEDSPQQETGEGCPAATCSALRELVFSRAIMDRNVSVGITSDSGVTVGELTKSELEGVIATLRQAGWAIFGQNACALAQPGAQDSPNTTNDL